MSIKALVTNLTTDAAADAVVDYMFNDYFTSEKAALYLEKYFNQDVRTAVFSGGVIYGRYVILSPAAALLKSAFQRRYARSGGTRFPPLKAYHVTSGAHIAELIAKTGFIKTATTVCGDGACFFTQSEKAEAYAPPSVPDPHSPHQAARKIVIEVTIFSRLAETVMPSGSDLVTFYRRPMDILVVKNPLVIFPTAAYYPGEKRLNVGG